MLAVRKERVWVQEELPKQDFRTPAVPRASETERKILRIIGSIILVAGLAMICTLQSEAIVRAGYDLVRAKSQAAALEKENVALKLEIAKLKSPQRIQQFATTKLGMVSPQGIYYSTINDTASALNNVASEGIRRGDETPASGRRFAAR